MSGASTIFDQLKAADGMTVANLLYDLIGRLNDTSGDSGSNPAVTLCAEIRASGAVPLICNLITHKDWQIHQLAINVVGSLASDAVEPRADLSKRELKQAGAFGHLLRHLFSVDHDTLLYTLVAIQNMCTEIECVDQLKAAGGIERLQHIVSKADVPELRQYAQGCLANARTVTVIDAMQRKVSKVSMTKGDATKVLEAFVRRWRAQRAAAATALGLANEVETLVGQLKAADVEALFKLLHHLVGRLEDETGDSAVAMCAEIRASGAVPLICNFLAHENGQIHRLAITIVGNLASGAVDPRAHLSRRELKKAGAFGHLLRHLFSANKTTLLYALCAIQNMCTEIEYVDQLKAAGGIERLQHIVSKADVPELRQYAQGCLANARTVTVIDAMQRKVSMTKGDATKVLEAFVRRWRAQRAAAATALGLANEVETAVRVHAKNEEVAEMAAAETEATETETAEKAAAEKAAAAKVAAEKAAANQVAAAKVEAEIATGEKNKAAAKLQAAHRGKGSRAKAAEIKMVNKKKVNEEKLAEGNAAEAEEKAAAEKAATKVQAAKRGKDGRIKVEKVKEDKAATKLQAAKRGKDGREKVKKNKAATNLQAAKQDNQAIEKQAIVLAVTALSAQTPEAAFVEGLIAAADAGSPSEVAQARAVIMPASISCNTSPGLDTPDVHPDNLGIRLFNDGEEVRQELRRALPAPPSAAHMPAVSTFTTPEPEFSEKVNEEKAAEEKAAAEKAATKVQAAKRGKDGRIKVEKVKEDKAATKLQAAKRGKDGREKVKKNKAAAAAEAWAMEEAERGEVAAREDAATKLQARVRGQGVRRHAGSAKAEAEARAAEESEAATKLQARVRGQGVRRHATESRAEQAALARANCPNESLEGPWDEEIRLSATRVQAQARGRGVQRQRAANYAKEAEALTREAEALLYRYKSIAEEAEEALEEALDTSASREGTAPRLDAVHNSLYVSETWSEAWPEASAGHSPRAPLVTPLAAVPARSLQWAPMLPQPPPPPQSPLSLSRPPSPRQRTRTPCELSVAQQVGAAWLWPEPTAQLSMERRPLTPMIPYLTPNQSQYPSPRPYSTLHSKPWEVTSITVAGSGLSGCTALPAPMQVAVHRYDASWMPRNLPTTTAIVGIRGSLRNSLPVISHIGIPIRASSPCSYPNQDLYEYPGEFTARPDHLQNSPPTSPRGSQLAYSRSLSPGSTLPNRPLTPRKPPSASSKIPKDMGPIVSTEALRLLPLQSSWTRPATLPRLLSPQLLHAPSSPREALEQRQRRPASVSTSRRDAMAMRPRLHIAGLLDELESWPVAVPLALIQTA